MAAGDNSIGTKSGAIAFGAIALLVIGVLASQGSNPSTNSAGAQDNRAEELVQAPTTTPPAPEPLNSASARKGEKLFQLVSAAEGATGAIVYSQNCFDALGRRFSWSKLDLCGAFDIRSVRDLAEQPTGSPAYFESETAAGRYLAAAIKGGEQPEAADRRLALLEAKVRPSRDAASGETPDINTDDSSTANGSSLQRDNVSVDGPVAADTESAAAQEINVLAGNK
jgi:hypothetical protein